MRWVTWVLFVATAFMAMNVGVRQASYGELQRSILTRDITQVEMQGAMDGPDGMGSAQGTATVRILWNEGGALKAVEILQVSSRDVLGQYGGSVSGAVVVGAVDPELRRLNPDLQIVRSEAPTGVWVTVFGRQIHGAWGLLAAGLLLQFLVLVMASREPRFATRMGWFWLALSPLAPLTIPAFLLAGWKGQVAGERRLNGIWAFVIVAFLIPLVWL